MSKTPAQEAAALSGDGDKVIFKNVAGGKGFAGSKVITQEAGTSQTLKISDLVEPTRQSATEGETKPEPAPALTAEQIQELVNNAIAPALEQAASKDAEIAKLKAEAEEAKQAAELTEKAKADAEALIEAAKQEAAEAKQAADAEAEELRTKLETAQKAEKAMTELGKLTGSNTETKTIEVLGTGSQEMRNWQQMLKNAPGGSVMHNNKQFTQKDTRAARDYMVRNQSAIRDGVEAELREAGYLQGAGSAVFTNAPTVLSDIPSTAFDYLSEFVRRPTDNTLIYAQFARSYAVPGTAPRFQGQVPRYPFSPGPSIKADRILTPGVDIGTGRQAVVEQRVPVTIEELGLGKDNNNSPISLSNFVQAFSLPNLEAVVERNLGRDYQRTKDLFIRTEFFTSNTVVYNNSNRVVSTPAEVLANGIGCASRGFLRALKAQMSTMQIPTYANGCYALTLTPNQVQYLLDELAAQQRFPEPSSNEIEMISKILQNEDEDYGGEVSGYRMTLDGFMIFEQNVHSTGAAGTTGAQNEAFDPGATLTETCFAIGADSVCWATALPVEIRQDEVTNFGRRDSWIWYSHENSATLDINEVIESSVKTRERRVLQVRLSRDPV